MKSYTGCFDSVTSVIVRYSCNRKLHTKIQYSYSSRFAIVNICFTKTHRLSYRQLGVLARFSTVFLACQLIFTKIPQNEFQRNTRHAKTKIQASSIKNVST